ncbi:YtxH domain-containing protein [Gleimia sp. 6138-11-ORH1]|uniref:YtxH domain-containing protein n=1 Tax=Gleimia sp. 6138-11-ORH1 TaxID=2973937 RepID=UPI002167CE5B|nr:YtxH domain-containing protein [Gleimia sp. 6138-11-ORH1]MCS4485094.1 YtxH domain-containing protein [Gleimia sp. 6138-11-ORH1]
MGTKFGLFVGAGLGYVLGTRAGKERYEQLRTWATKIRQNKLVSKPLDAAAEKVSDAVRKGGEAATDKVVSLVKEQLFGQSQTRVEYVEAEVVEVEVSSEQNQNTENK